MLADLPAHNHHLSKQTVGVSLDSPLVLVLCLIMSGTISVEKEELVKMT
jgi:hypothetical protein